MTEKIYSIPFRGVSSLGDYACRDGEVESLYNMIADDGGEGGNASTGADNEAGNNSENSTGNVAGGEEGGGGNDGMPVSVDLPQPPSVRFLLEKSTVGGWHIHPDIFPTKVVDAPKTSATDAHTLETLWGERARELITSLERDAARGNLFLYPFFAVAAWRMADGSHVMPSAPVMLIPNSAPPAVEGNADFTVSTMKMDVLAAVCSLKWRLAALPDKDKWDAKITHLDIFVSLPIALHSPKGEMKAFHRTRFTYFTHCLDTSGSCGEHIVPSDTVTQAWQPEEAAPDLKGALATFRKISEIPLEDVVASSGFSDVSFNCGALSMPEELETYTPEYAHERPFSAAGGAMISGRHTLWDITHERLALPPLEECVPATDAEDYFPRWIFVADPDVRSYPFEYNGESHRVAMRRHPSLCGAYYWQGFSGHPRELAAGAPEGYAGNEGGTRRNEVWRSRKESGSLFPDGLLFRLDVERVIALCRAFRASGLVATTSPTVYAFTTEGIFLLKEMDDGTFRDAGLISTHRLRDARSFTVRGKVVEFITDTSARMVIEGTSVKAYADSSLSGSSASGLVVLRPVEEGRCRFVTRPIKLDGGTTRKRVRAVELVGDYSPEGMRLTLSGSRDLHRWIELGSATGGCLCALWGPSLRFLRITGEGTLTPSDTLEALHIRLW